MGFLSRLSLILDGAGESYSRRSAMPMSQSGRLPKRVSRGVHEQHSVKLDDQQIGRLLALENAPGIDPRAWLHGSFAARATDIGSK